MKSQNKFYSALSEESIFAQTKGIIDDALAAKEPEILASPMHSELTVRQFQMLKGFHGSKAFLHEIVNVYLGRLANLAAKAGIVVPDEALGAILSAETRRIQEVVVRQLQNHYTERFGVVPPNRVAELDELVNYMRNKMAEKMEAIAALLNRAAS